MSQFKILNAIIVAMALAGPAYAASGDVMGTWLTEDGGAKVRVTPCGNAVCGSVVWLKEPKTPDGKPRLDVENSDASLRTRPIMGLPILLGLVPDGAERLKGKVYNAEDGRTYTGYITMQPDNRLKLEGCVLGGLICESQVWTRAK